MVNEEKARELIRMLVYRCYDSFNYGKKVQGFGTVWYKVGNKKMTLSEYQEYCFKKEIKKFDIK